MLLLDNLKTLFTQNLNYREKDVPSNEHTSVLIDFVQQAKSTYRREIDDWNTGRSLAYNPLHPQRYALIRSYEDAMLDTHLTAVFENRALRVINKKFRIADSQGNVDENKSKLFQKAWFRDYLRYYMESLLFGYSPIQLYFKGKEASFTKLLPREHILTDQNLLVKQVGQTEGIAFDDKQFKKYLLNLQIRPQSMGLLEKAVPLTILKRHSWGSWDMFEQKFGLPITIAKTASRDPKAQNEIRDWLQKLGRSAHGIFPKHTEIELHESNRTDAFEVFMKKIEAVDAQISKLVDGQTMTTDNGSSRSQSEVHENTANERTKADLEVVLMHLDDVLLPFLRQHAFYASKLSQGDTFIVEEKINKEKQIAIDKELLGAGYVLKQEYIEQTYGVEIEAMPKQGTEQEKEHEKQEEGNNKEHDGEEDKDDTKKKTKITNHSFTHSPNHSFTQSPNHSFTHSLNHSLTHSLNELYFEHDCRSEHRLSYIQLNNEPSLDSFFEAFLQFVYNQEGEVAEFLMTATASQLLNAFTDSFKPESAFGHPDQQTMQAIRTNLFRFSGAKTLQQHRELNALLFDEGGNLLPFTQFRQKVLEIGTYSQYNEIWLETEREMAFIAGQSVRQWKDFEATKEDFPYLIYNTVGDSRVRPSHQALNGTKLPMDHPFWQTYYPPNGWLCRCFVTQSNSAEGISNAERATELGEAALDKKRLFAFNPALTNEVFSEGHPYFVLSQTEIIQLQKAVNSITQ